MVVLELIFAEKNSQIYKIFSHKVTILQYTKAVSQASTIQLFISALVV